MTLTSMGCPMGPQIIDQVKTVLAEIPEIQDTEVNIVWIAPGTKDIMSRYSKIALGMR
ncbi:metal-sulfur cluster assembly factor, partial [Staphylococcus aureus]|uniref:metal-sulfur cluster assembly factor n=1 Tax=Staphylococcus aureus TaxID=1280 RepID=UPI00065B6B97